MRSPNSRRAPLAAQELLHAEAMTAEDRLDAMERELAGIRADLDVLALNSAETTNELDEFAERRGWRLCVPAVAEDYHYRATVFALSGGATLASATAHDRFEAAREALKAALAAEGVKP
jgi:hypothetical protein